MTLSRILFVILFVAATGGSFYVISRFSKVPGLFEVSREMEEPGVNMVLKNIRLYEKEGDKTVVDLSAKKAVINQKDDRIALEEVYSELYDPGRPPVRISSDRGIVYTGTKDFRLIGQVKVKSDDGITLATETLDWDNSAGIFRTDDFVTIRGERFLLTGTGMESTIDPKDIKLNKDVSATFY